MSALLKSELLKLRTVRTPRYSLLGLLALTLVIASVAAVSIPREGVSEEGTAGEMLRVVLGVAGGFLPAMVMLVLGALSAAGEFHHGTILGTYLVTPARRRVLAAKLLVTAGVGAVVGLFCSVATLALVVPIAGARGMETGLHDTAAGVGLVAACVGAAALSAALGVGLGACFRQPVIAIVAILGWASLGEGLVGAVVPEPLLPIGAIRTTVAPGSDVPVWVSPTALAICTVLTALVAARVFTRKDITV